MICQRKGWNRKAERSGVCRAGGEGGKQDMDLSFPLISLGKQFEL